MPKPVPILTLKPALNNQNTYLPLLTSISISPLKDHFKQPKWQTLSWQCRAMHQHDAMQHSRVWHSPAGIRLWGQQYQHQYLCLCLCLYPYLHIHLSTIYIDLCIYICIYPCLHLYLHLNLYLHLRLYLHLITSVPTSTSVSTSTSTTSAYIYIWQQLEDSVPEACSRGSMMVIFVLRQNLALAGDAAQDSLPSNFLLAPTMGP